MRHDPSASRSPAAGPAALVLPLHARRQGENADIDWLEARSHGHRTPCRQELAWLRVARETDHGKLVALTVQFAPMPPARTQEPAALIADLMYILPVLGVDIVHAIAVGARFVQFDSRRGPEDAIPGHSLHARLRLFERAAEALAGDRPEPGT